MLQPYIRRLFTCEENEVPLGFVPDMNGKKMMVFVRRDNLLFVVAFGHLITSRVSYHNRRLPLLCYAE